MSKPHYYSDTIGVILPSPRPQAPPSSKKKRRWWPGMDDGPKEPTFTADELHRNYPRSMLEKDETSIQNRRFNRKAEAVPPAQRKRLPHHGRVLPTGYESIDDQYRIISKSPKSHKGER